MDEAAVSGAAGEGGGIDEEEEADRELVWTGKRRVPSLAGGRNSKDERYERGLEGWLRKDTYQRAGSVDSSRACVGTT